MHTVVVVLIEVLIIIGLSRIKRLERILVPYAANTHDDLGLDLALRLLVNT